MAERALRRALTLDPNRAATYHDLAWSLVAQRRFDEGVAAIVRARDLAPASPRATTDVGWVFLQINRPADARAACEHTLDLFPDSREAQVCLERAHRALGEPAKALAAARRTLPSTDATRALEARVATLDPAAALDAIWQWRLERSQASGRGDGYGAAAQYAALGQADRAFAALDAALAARSQMLVLLDIDPAFRALRHDARMQSLRARVVAGRRASGAISD